jgi:hypothetical protein
MVTCYALMLGYLLVAGTFRWLMSIAGVALMAVWLGVCLAMTGTHFASLFRNGPSAQSEALALVILVFTVPFIVAQACLMAWLCSHRLAPQLPRTFRMTSSLQSSLSFRLPSVAKVTPAGFLVHLGVVVMTMILLVMFPAWFARAIGAGIASLALQLYEYFLFVVHAIVKALQGVAPFASTDVAKLMWGLDDIGRLFAVFAGALAASAAWRFGQRLNRRRHDEVILALKPPVLLLRSFMDDVAGIKPNNIILSLFRRRKRLEECLGEELAEAGPFVAVGKPGENLPPLGAQRLYLADDKWQEVVKSYIDRAGLIILIAGKTHWVRWELSTIMELSQLSRLLIVFPPLPRSERMERWKNLSAAFNGTIWEAAACEIDVANTLMIYSAPHGGMVRLLGRSARESDYEAAFRVATHQMRANAQ